MPGYVLSVAIPITFGVLLIVFRRAAVRGVVKRAEKKFPSLADGYFKKGTTTRSMVAMGLVLIGLGLMALFSAIALYG